MKYLITAALPYANGPLHFGHLAGAYIPADIYNRHRKLQGYTTKFICGSDEHGVAIMLAARKAGMNYQEYVNSWNKDHAELFKAYGIEFDVFGQTSAPYHHEEVVRWFAELHDKGMIEPKQEQQLFCNSCKNHLPDRFVEGTCYICGYANARGDECPQCGAWIEPVKLKNPVCKICGSHEIEEVTVTQYYLLLSKFHKQFQDWFKTRKHWRKTIVPYVESLSNENLQDRAITRDLDWGIDVPLADAKGKKLYVWFDAPIGYVSNLKHHLKEIGSNEDYINDWWKNKDVEITNFIGKDNIIFHAIIFPVMCMATGFVNPVHELPANQYVNLEGKQFSKSSGWYVDSKKALSDFGVDALRYYLISLIPETADTSFVWKQFAAKVNNELANNIGNLVSRAFKFLEKNWAEGLDGKYFQGFADGEQGRKAKEAILEIQNYMDTCQFKKAMDRLMLLGQEANTYFSDQAPWAQVKVDKDAAAHTIAYSSIYIYILGILFRPFIPGLADKILSYFSQRFLDPAVLQDIYVGKIFRVDELFKGGMKIERAVEVLVPKIDEKYIEQLDQELKKLGEQV